MRPIKAWLILLCLLSVSLGAEPKRDINKGIQLVMFSADWCSVCQEMKPVLAELYRKGWPVWVASAEHPHNADILRSQRLTRLPAWVMYYNGEPVSRSEGRWTAKGLADWITREQLKHVSKGPLADPVNREFFRTYHWELSPGTCGMLGCTIHGGGWRLVPDGR